MIESAILKVKKKSRTSGGSGKIIMPSTINTKAGMAIVESLLRHILAT
jgi:hypothetical protein